MYSNYIIDVFAFGYNWEEHEWDSNVVVATFESMQAGYFDRGSNTGVGGGQYVNKRDCLLVIKFLLTLSVRKDVNLRL